MLHIGHTMDDKMKLFILVIISIMTISCASLTKQIDDSLDSEIGWMHGNCLAIKNPDIPLQYEFTLVHLDEEDTVEKAIISKKTTKGEECYPLLDDRANINKSSGYFFYLVKSKKPVNLAIGILKPEGLPVSGNEISYCNTTEGLQFSISKNNSVIWQGYYYLGYESDPTCKAE